MSFSSLWFVFAFLPPVLILYYVLPAKLKNLLLVLVSFLFYAWGEPRYLILLLLSVLFNYAAGLELYAHKKSGHDAAARTALVTAVVVNLLILGYFKYAGFLIDNINALLGTHIAAKALPLPLGISFFTFTALSYIFEVYSGKAEAQRDPLTFALYVSFFPKIMSGPIVRYEEMEAELTERTVTVTDAGRGMAMFLAGLMKKVLLADNLGTAFSAVSGMTQMSSLTAILGMVFYSLELYFDFSGYSDMAIGLAAMFGFHFDKNFDYPYLSKNISEFWRRWHISLGAWFRNYVYIPLGGNRRGEGRQLFNLLVVWLLTGIWHGASWSFVVWGLWHGAFIILERFVIRDRLDRVPGFLRVIGTCVIVFFGWVFFFSPTLGSALHYLGQIFGAGGLGLIDATAKYYLSENLILLIAGILLCGPVVQNLFLHITAGRSAILKTAAGVLFALGVLWCVAGMVGATYSTFLYFQF